MPDDAMQPEEELRNARTGLCDDDSTEPREDSTANDEISTSDRCKSAPGEQPTVDDLVDQLQEAKSEIEDLNRRYLRALADYDNAKRRAQTERDGLRSQAICDFVSSLLPVIDNLDRAIEMGEQADTQGMVDGLRMVRSQITDVLRSEGIRCIEAVGTQFDPNKHDAVMQAELEDFEDNVIVEEFQRGYEADGRVIRPSMVKVNKIRV